ncbi:MAG: hypothetical protein MUO52_02630, partial [Desulfobacterales bacterium]|nr:hypothetical protein [Desulfobacterales bacterium]
MEFCCLYLGRSMSFSQIGRRMGEVSVAALSQNRKRLAGRMKEDKELRKRVEDLKRCFESD